MHPFLNKVEKIRHDLEATMKQPEEGKIAGVPVRIIVHRLHPSGGARKDEANKLRFRLIFYAIWCFVVLPLIAVTGLYISGVFSPTAGYRLHLQEETGQSMELNLKLKKELINQLIKLRDQREAEQMSLQFEVNQEGIRKLLEQMRLDMAADAEKTGNNEGNGKEAVIQN